MSKLGLFTFGRVGNLLFLCEYPPSNLAGAPLIFKRLLSFYPQNKLFILCSAVAYRSALRLSPRSLLPCTHVSAFWRRSPSRYRALWPLAKLVAISSLPNIVLKGLRLVKKHQINFLLTSPWSGEFAVSAYLISRILRLPLYVYEMDDWEEGSKVGSRLDYLFARLFARRIFRSASKVWVISPTMAREYKDRYQIESEFMHNFVDVNEYEQICGSGKRNLSDEPVIIYTGSIHDLHCDGLKALARCIQYNAEQGLKLKLLIYSKYPPNHIINPPLVQWCGFRDESEIPHVLAQADILFHPITFSQKYSSIVRTSLLAKTAEYLAAGRPILVRGPRDSAVVEYLAQHKAALIVNTPDDEALRQAILSLINDRLLAESLAINARTLARQYHDSNSVVPKFLENFVEPA